MVFFVRITVNQSHLRPICKSTKFNPKIQRTIYLINFQQLRLHVPDFIRTVVQLYFKFLPKEVDLQKQERKFLKTLPQDAFTTPYASSNSPSLATHYSYHTYR